MGEKNIRVAEFDDQYDGQVSIIMDFSSDIAISSGIVRIGPSAASIISKFNITDTIDKLNDVEIDSETYIVEEVVRMLFTELKKDIAIEDINPGVVIAVPAHYNGNSVDCLRRGILRTGFIVHDVITEPIAASIRFGMPNCSKTCYGLVVDLNDVRLLVSIVKSKFGQLKLKSSARYTGTGHAAIRSSIKKTIEDAGLGTLDINRVFCIDKARSIKKPVLNDLFPGRVYATKDEPVVVAGAAHAADQIRCGCRNVYRNVGDGKCFETFFIYLMHALTNHLKEKIISKC